MQLSINNRVATWAADSQEGNSQFKVCQLECEPERHNTQPLQLLHYLNKTYNSPTRNCSLLSA